MSLWHHILVIVEWTGFLAFWATIIGGIMKWMAGPR